MSSVARAQKTSVHVVREMVGRLPVLTHVASFLWGYSLTEFLVSELAVARIHASKSTGLCSENMEGVETVRTGVHAVCDGLELLVKMGIPHGCDAFVVSVQRRSCSILCLGCYDLSSKSSKAACVPLLQAHTHTHTHNPPRGPQRRRGFTFPLHPTQKK